MSATQLGPKSCKKVSRVRKRLAVGHAFIAEPDTLRWRKGSLAVREVELALEFELRQEGRGIFVRFRTPSDLVC